MKLIKARGIVSNNILNSNAIYRYDFKTGKFNEYDKNKLYRLFNRVYLNSYDRQYSLSSIINELPQVDFNQVNNYYKYNDVKDNILDIEELQKQLQIYLDENQENKKEFAPIRWKPQSQLQHLINNDILTDGRTLLKYDVDAKKLEVIDPKGTARFFRNVKNSDCISAIGVMQNYSWYCRNLTNIGTELSDKFKNYHIAQNILTNCKNDYDAIKGLIDTFN